MAFKKKASPPFETSVNYSPFGAALRPEKARIFSNTFIRNSNIATKNIQFQERRINVHFKGYCRGLFVSDIQILVCKYRNITVLLYYTARTRDCNLRNARPGTETPPPPSQNKPLTTNRSENARKYTRVNLLELRSF